MRPRAIPKRRRDAQLERLAYRAGEVAQWLGLSRTRIYQLMASGKMPSCKVGASVLIPANSLRRWLAKHTGTRS
jgi:excisionase family DNA binding protein